jgi:hypothetical protein
MGQDMGAKQMIVFSKRVFENTANMVTMLQDNTEKISSDLLKRMPGVPEEGLKPWNESVAAFKEMRKEYIKMTTDNFDNLEKMFS